MSFNHKSTAQRSLTSRLAFSFARNPKYFSSQLFVFCFLWRRHFWHLARCKTSPLRAEAIISRIDTSTSSRGNLLASIFGRPPRRRQNWGQLTESMETPMSLELGRHRRADIFSAFSGVRQNFSLSRQTSFENWLDWRWHHAPPVPTSMWTKWP